MARQARRKSSSGIYHIVWRGVNRQEIFHDDYDCAKFLNVVLKYKEMFELNVYGWCLMNNHVHLLVREGNESLSDTMKRIGVSYVSYYHLKYDTTGSLFQGRFHSEPVDTLRYLLTVIRYIHQNPLKAGMVTELSQWRWSSYRGYYGENIFPKGLLESTFILNAFSLNVAEAKKQYKVFHEKINEDEDQCLDIPLTKRRMTDDEARKEIRKLLGKMEIALVKSLPREKRNPILREVKQIKGVSQRQAARILGISPNLIFKA